MDPKVEPKTEPKATPQMRTIFPCRGPAVLAAGVFGGLTLWFGLFPSAYYLAWGFLLVAVWSLTIVVALLHGLFLEIWHRIKGHRSQVRFSGAGLLVGWLVLVSVLLAAKIPLRLHFALARSSMDEIRTETATEPLEYPRTAAGFTIDRVGEGRCDATRRLFHIRNDGGYFVYSPHGTDGLCYNSGSKGALGGGWHWMVED